MPTFAELQKRLKRRPERSVRLGADEVLITDARASMRPGDFVDEKLRAAQGCETRPDGAESQAFDATGSRLMY
jgi:hypothetical protein